MYRIMTQGYDAKEKIVIAKQYMLPKIRDQVNFQPEDIVIPDETIKYIVGTKHLTQEEAGVRNMKRCLEIIYTKLNLFRLMKPDENLFSKDIKMEVKFPMTVTNKEVDILIKNEEKQSQSLLSMYI
jgi:ATP-dependent Lon protease